MIVAVYCGLPVHVSKFVPDPPRLRLADDVPVSDAFRATFNLWLLKRFGTNPDEPQILRFDARPFGLDGPALILHERHWPKVRAQLLRTMSAHDALAFLKSESVL